MMTLNCAEHTLCFEAMKGAGPALIALVVAIVGWFLTRLQYRVARGQLNLNLFDRRYALYEQVWSYLSQAANSAPGPDSKTHIDFTNAYPKFHFLFGKDIAHYVQQAGENAIALWSIQTRRKSGAARLTPDDDRRELELTSWFATEAISGAKARFAPYMAFDEWHEKSMLRAAAAWSFKLVKTATKGGATLLKPLR
ncbi:hypothetical protein [Burkholderia dolosa]|uniref:hypothetical protein n=1 Tax=Burkholderia dolosa TaxID=152500 RepID=UPI001C98E0B0|nr:hypothetical protein [Burkholderia dolosa]MBY4833665.1 hypothetical protein [Burkholderia dolosa]